MNTKINAKTKVCAVIGNPIEHSLSPAIHNAAFFAEGLNWVYVAFRVEDLKSAIAGIRSLGIVGVSVTIPHKIEIIRYLDEIDSTAEGIGSVNTIINRDGILKGYNSDGEGALRAFESMGVNLKGKNVLILGSGGAARAIAFTLAFKKAPLQMSILGIEKDELFSLSKDIEEKTPISPKAELLTPQTLSKFIRESDILIHCTPVGMYPEIENSLVPADMLHKGLLVFDIVYNPLKTKLIKEAESLGCKTISGIEMFLNQAVIQFELWTGKSAPKHVMRKVLEEHFK